MPLVFVIFLLLQKPAAVPKATEVGPPSAPALTVSFERQSIRQNDCVNVQLLVANGSELEFNKPLLDVAAPRFLAWYDGRCEDTQPEVRFGIPSMPVLALSTIPARSTLKRNLHVRTGDTIDVGEYNGLFVVEYSWATKTSGGNSFVSAEKPIKVTFLGNESVAGIPLALAGFIVPGLLFWLMIKAFGASWSIDGMSNQMLYSVMVSIAIVTIGTWMDLWDISTGISIGRLITLASIGALIGLVVGSGDLIVRKIKESQKVIELERQIKFQESEDSLLGKLLELPPSKRLDRPIIWIHEGSRAFAGSVGACTELSSGESIYSLVGSFEIDWKKVKDKDVEQRMKAHLAAREMRKLVSLAKESETLVAVEQVQRVDGDGLQPTERTFMQWRAADVFTVQVGTEGWTTEVLAIK